MAYGKIILCFALLGNLSVILAQDGANSQNSPPSSPAPHREEHEHDDHSKMIPFLTPFVNMFSQFANMSGSPFPFAGLFNSRAQELSGSDFEIHNDTNNDEHSQRLFFHFPRFTGCNYTTKPGLACFSCRQRVNCLRSNVGIVTRCGFLAPYCSGNGTCSQTQGELC